MTWIPFLGLGECEVTTSFSLFPSPLWPSVVVLVRVAYVGQTDLFKNHSYSIGSCVKKPLLKRFTEKKCKYEPKMTAIFHKITLDRLTCHWNWSFSKKMLSFSSEIRNKVGGHSRGWPESSLFNSYYTQGRALLLFLDCSTLPLIHTL